MFNLNKKSWNVILGTVFLLGIMVSPPVYAVRIKSSGKILTLRVHEVGTKYGQVNDSIDTEVVMTLNTQQGKAFGFKLRNDDNKYTHQGMLNLLRDAFNYNHNITIVYDICPGNDVKEPCKNGTILRLWLTKSQAIINGGGVFRDPGTKKTQ